MVRILNINRITVLGLHVIILSRWAALDTVYASPFKRLKTSVCQCSLNVSPRHSSCMEVLVLSGLRMTGFWLLKFLFFLLLIIQISTAASWWTPSVLFTHVCCLLSENPLPFPASLLPSLQCVWFPVWGVWNIIRMILILLLFICSVLRLLCHSFFWNFKGIVKYMPILFLLK